MKEMDMYKVIKQYLELKDFKVQAEVNNIDIVATNSDTIIIVEMKTQLSMKLLYQGCQRQKLSDNVYIAVPIIRNRKILKERLHIVKRLHLGLLFVDIENNKVEVVQDPGDFVFRRSKKKKQKLLNELSLRNTNKNIGGTTRRKIITAYREKVIHIAYYLQEREQSLKELRNLTNIQNVSSIMQKNYYKWFERVDRGIYGLTNTGKNELLEYEELFELIIGNKEQKYNQIKK